ncbi:RNA methyltransferase [Aliikangiella sp. G2MR2-5]|uniref:RNA methyltransferase n=1 Tax=Aliikangiella sp. G2MR2-5 TaxID=2788943 RepID=UPI0018A96277|nr:RNA methyltransferase [Aliikangiella sp. G2MR2-5]
MLDQIRTVLSHTTHPGNVGATARALKVMGLSQLALVNPKDYPSAEATRRASRATDILANATIHDNLDSAIADCQLVVGTSARTRTLPSKLISPRELAEEIKTTPDRVPVAILFGTENSGLTNEELHKCHYHVCIPTNPEYSSLNLGSAVQLIAYEMRLALSEEAVLPEQRVVDSEQHITHEQLSGLLQHFDKVMQLTGYKIPKHAKYLDLRLERLLCKAEVTTSEYNILRGFLSSVEKYSERLSSGVLEKIEQSQK